MLHILNCFWRCQHRFQEEGGGIRMGDLVNYALPLGLFGETIHSWRTLCKLTLFLNCIQYG